MVATLLTTGIACIIAAIVGGGLKAFAIEIPVLASGRRQAALGLFGGVLLLVGFALNYYPRPGSATQTETVSTGPPSQATTASATCSPAWFGKSPPDRVKAIESG